MKKRILPFLLLITLLAGTVPGGPAAEETVAASLETIMDGIEKRYAGGGFTARFDQTSTLKAIDITDTASGTLYVEPPGKMRWEYESPYRQLIITDGHTLWVYRPDDQQVMVGDAPDYLGDGKGASFLADIRMVRRNFSIRLLAADTKLPYHRLRLDPKKPIPGLSTVYLDVSRDDYDVVRVTTVNPYGDETVMAFSRLRLDQTFEDGFFRFQVPPGVDVLQMENRGRN